MIYKTLTTPTTLYICSNYDEKDRIDVEIADDYIGVSCQNVEIETPGLVGIYTEKEFREHVKRVTENEEFTDSYADSFECIQIVDACGKIEFFMETTDEEEKDFITPLDKTEYLMYQLIGEEADTSCNLVVKFEKYKNINIVSYLDFLK